MLKIQSTHPEAYKYSTTESLLSNKSISNAPESDYGTGESDASKLTHKKDLYSHSDDNSNDSYSTFDSNDDTEMKNCPSSTPRELSRSTTHSSINFAENSYEPDYLKNSTDLYDIVDQIRFLISKTINTLESCSDEMRHTVRQLNK